MAEPRPDPIRVGIVIQSLVRGAGTEEQIRLLARHLPGRGVECALCLTGDEPPADVPPLASPPEVLGMRRTVSPGGVRGMLRFRAWVRRERPGVLLSYWRDADLVCAAGSGGAPVVAARRNIGAGYVHTPRELRRTRLVNRRISGWVANSQAVRHYTISAEGVPGDRVTVLPNLLDTDRFRPPGEGERVAARRDLAVSAGMPVFVCVANLRPVKRHEDLLNAFARVREQLPRAVLLLVGSGSRESELREQAAPLGDAVRFLGSRPDPERVLWAADAAVLSSLAEGFPNALLEAAATGLPLVGTDGGGTAELIRSAGAGETVPARDPGALAAAMARVVQDPGKAGTAGREYVLGRHAIPVAVSRWARFLRETVSP